MSVATAGHRYNYESSIDNFIDKLKRPNLALYRDFNSCYNENNPDERDGK